MVLTPDEYNDELWLIQKNNPPKISVLPFAEKIYDVDVKNRTINAPEFLSVQKDHRAESIYFKMDRYNDYVDLVNMTCIIQYKTKNGDGIYVVPYYDIASYPGKLLIPWLIDGRATAVSGDVTYSIRFYKMDDAATKFVYNLNFLPATSKVKYGMDVISDNLPDYEVPAPLYQDLVAKYQEMVRQDMYWIEMK